MNRSLPVHHSLRAFTLIELLVVISIIAVLAGLLLPVVSKVTTNAQKVQAKSTEVQIVAAVKSFQTDYGVYPIPSGYTGSDVCFGSDTPTVTQLFDALQADNLRTEASTATQLNTRSVVYIELPTAKNQTVGQIKNGLSTANGMLYDPWGTIYLVGIDGDYDNFVNNPYSSGAGLDPKLELGVIVYSWGPDTLTTSNFFGGGSKTDPTSVDDVISWQ